jgi:Heavy metal binding domain
MLVVAWLIAWSATVFHTHPHAQTSDLPPLVYVCPMHADVVDHKDGECPICKMGLEPMRLDTVHTCPIHSVVSEKHPGKCPICGRPLGEVTVSIAWRCGGSDTDLMEPQACKDGTQAVRVQKSLAHGNHNPQHGGQFFMAADNWHHIEGTYPSPGVFRLYFYDDYTKPLPLAKVKEVKARLVTKEETDPKTFVTKEVASVPLTLSAEGNYLEAAIEALPLPANITLQAVFTKDSKEQRFDFTFAEHSVAATTDAVDGATRLAMDVPADPGGVLKMLVERREAVKEIVARGGFTEVWVPALQAKELALALEMFAREFPERRRGEVEAATKQIVLAAFRLDAAGDRGEREEVQKASTSLVTAVDTMETVFGGRR